VGTNENDPVAASDQHSGTFALALRDSAALDIVPLDPDVLALHIDALDRASKKLAESDRAKRTRDTYSWAWGRFVAWCLRRSITPLPTTSDTIRWFATDATLHGIEALEKPKPNRAPRTTKVVGTRTLRIYLAAINYAHRVSELPEPTLDEETKRVLEGIWREKGRPPIKKGALSVDQITKILDTLPTNTKRGLRDRALILTTYMSGGRRRAETTQMAREDLVLEPDGYVWTIPKSKRDQTGQGLIVPIPREPLTGLPSAAEALSAWLAVRGEGAGAVFYAVGKHDNVRPGISISGRVLADIVKEGAERIGLDPRGYSGHSLRASFVTNSHRAGKGLAWIMSRTGQKNADTVIGYIRRADLFKE
jgi:integrase